MTSTLHFTCTEKLDLYKIAACAENGKYDSKHFSGAVLKFSNPKCTILMFSTGKITCLGGKSEADCLLTMFKCTDILKNAGYEVSVTNFKVHNIVGTTHVGFQVDLIKLYEKHRKNCDYENELYPALFYHFNQKNPTAIIFTTGKIIMTGAKSKDELNKFFHHLRTILERL